MRFGCPTPILRIFDEHLALTHYVDYLSFAVDWEHRFEEGGPVYLQVSRGDCVLHLSEHGGDCTPGARTRVRVDDLDAFHRELDGKEYRLANPGIETTPWGERQVQIGDPFGNRLTFFQPIAVR